MLVTIDDAWREHLRQLDELRTSVQNATYEQKDPLLIYKFESFNLFKSMISTINNNIISSLSKLSIAVQPQNPEDMAAEQQRARERQAAELARRQMELERMKAVHGQLENGVQPIKVEKKVGRNDPCPCGSGKKYKQCHGKGVSE
jgi:preprotein translocase subunit SecA